MTTTEASDLMDEYRRDLVSEMKKSQDAFDKGILSLSGGALGVSFAFLDKVVKAGAVRVPWMQLLAWCAWGLSIVCILASFWFSQAALRKAIEQVDRDQIHDSRAGGIFDTLTSLANILAGSLFFIGVILMAVFVSANLGR